MANWTRLFLLGDLGQHLDLADAQDDIDRMHRRLHRQASGERHQDQRIAELEADVDELRVIVAELTRLLVRGGSLSEEAVTRLVTALEAAQQPAPGTPMRFESPAQDAPPPPRRFR